MDTDMAFPSGYDRWATWFINVLRAWLGLAPIVRYIVTHHRPHQDERFAIYLLRTSGNRRFAKIERARVLFWNPDTYNDGRSEKSWLREGFLFIGVREGRFDEHPHEQNPGHCAFTLVRDYLGYGDVPAWRWLGELVLRADTSRIARKRHLGRIVKELNNACSYEEVERVMNIIITTLLAAHERAGACLENLPDDKALCLPTIQVLLDELATSEDSSFVLTRIENAREHAQANFEQAVETLGEKALLHEVWNGQAGRDMRLVVIAHRPNYELAKAARWWQGAWRADMVLQFTIMDDGTPDMVYISTHTERGITDIDWLAAQLRKLEMEADPTLGPPTDEAVFASDGDGWTWYYHRVAMALYSGTPTHPHAPRTQLSSKAISILVRMFLKRCTFRPKKERRALEEETSPPLSVVA